MKIINSALGLIISLAALLGLIELLKPAQAAPVQASAAVGDHVIISEVFYDVAGSDDGWEWVELYNPTSNTIDLGSYSLGNGGTDYTSSKVQLTGSLSPSQCWVIGGPTTGITNYNPIFNQSVNFNPDFQNGATPADGIALFNVKAI
jgi:hypothetical protein